ncbi:CpsD/CapB family tyrosine-protein kinase [Arabiibacter massiliensis]|uniref:CpsD/CapB family tyrosine-protein kinase n=1 Tax=Arabiibacter massiliensis TaxID=1870985 RepID=UPI0009BB5B41|nr:CpsD/CapB family tyrosine-protein kinase [Arabiibacter massiliensis]
MAKKSKKILARFVHPQLSNASKTLLANIRFASVDEKVKTLVVTSSEQNEGKTIVSTNLANAIATSGKKVLIVEADMRRRSLGKLLDIHPAHGIYAALSGTASLNETIQPTNIPNLYFMDAEPSIPSPADILSTKRFASLVDKLRDSFDYVIFDTPPVSLFVDAAVLSSLVDGTLLVVRQNQTKRSVVVKCAQQLRVADARVLGTVMTFCTDDESNYYYAYYTQDGKRVEKGDSDKTAFAEGMSAPVEWEQDVQPSPRRQAAAARSAAQPRAGAGAGAGDARGGAAGAAGAGAGAGNPYAPNAFKSITTGGAKAPRHKNKPRS